MSSNSDARPDPDKLLNRRPDLRDLPDPAARVDYRRPTKTYLDSPDASEWDVDRVDRMLQSKAALEALKAGKSVDAIAGTWSAPLASFVAKRERFLLY